MGGRGSSSGVSAKGGSGGAGSIIEKSMLNRTWDKGNGFIDGKLYKGYKTKVKGNEYMVGQNFSEISYSKGNPISTPFNKRNKFIIAINGKRVGKTEYKTNGEAKKALAKIASR